MLSVVCSHTKEMGGGSGLESMQLVLLSIYQREKKKMGQKLLVISYIVKIINLD